MLDAGDGKARAPRVWLMRVLGYSPPDLPCGAAGGCVHPGWLLGTSRAFTQAVTQHFARSQTAGNLTVKVRAASTGQGGAHGSSDTLTQTRWLRREPEPWKAGTGKALLGFPVLQPHAGIPLPMSTRHGHRGGPRAALTSRCCTSSFTLAAVSVDCLPDEASFINVDRKFLHFFTFSIVSCGQFTETKVKSFRKQTVPMAFN